MSASIRFFTPSQECPGTRKGQHRIAIDGAINMGDGVYSVSPYTFRKMRKVIKEGSIKYCPRFRYRRKLRRIDSQLYRDIFCTWRTPGDIPHYNLDWEDWA